MTRYVMVADLERCVGCQTCTAACRHANATSPAVQWRSVLDIEAGAYPDVSRTFVPVGCQHCEDPPCMHVCPTTATRKRADGIVTVDYDLCIGCAYCEVACPYQARFKISEQKFAYGAAMTNEGAREDERRLGVSQKCTFCSDRIDSGLAEGLVPGLDPRATPACVNSCIADALHFGDIEDPASNVSKLLRENSNFRMHAELGTDPNFFYLHDRRHTAPLPTLPRTRGRDGEGASAPIRAKGAEPKHQQHWDWKAAANFIVGGSGAALFALSVLYEVPIMSAVALGLMAVGFLILLFKIGRPLRFLYVLRQPQRSWMSREAWIAGFLFPLGCLFLLTGWLWAGLLAALAAVGFLIAQAMILKEAKGVPAWRTVYIVPFIIATGFAEGAALLSLLVPVPIMLAALVLLRGLAWHVYLQSLKREGAPTRALTVLDSCNAWFLWGGVALPAALIALDVTALAGVAVVATGYVLKFILITSAGYQQGFALERAAGLVKPGWTLADRPT